MIWNVKRFDVNNQSIVDYNVLKYYDDWIKKYKKKCATKAEFAEKLKTEMMWRFWSRSEYELIIELTNNNKILLKPWVGCYDKQKAAIDVTNDINFNWKAFSDKHIQSQVFGNRAKIDIYDQLQWQWDDFVDYIWHTRLKYQRDHSKFHEV